MQKLPSRCSLTLNQSLPCLILYVTLRYKGNGLVKTSVKRRNRGSPIESPFDRDPCSAKALRSGEQGERMFSKTGQSRTDINYFMIMKCSRCGFESYGFIPNGNCSVCGFFGLTGSALPIKYDDVAPWETESAEKFPLRAFAVTFRNSFFYSKRFFSKIARNPSLLPALMYGMVLGTTGICADALWNNIPSISPETLFSNSGMMSGFSRAAIPAKLIATPFFLIAWLFFSTLYVHSMLFLTRSKKKSFLFTFKTMCYAAGSMAFELVPLIGPMLSFFALMYLTIAGIHSVHEISIRRTLLVLLMPLLLLTIAVAIIGAIAVLASSLLSGAQLDPFSLFK